MNLDVLAVGEAAKDSDADQHKEDLLGSLRHGLLPEKTHKKKLRIEKKIERRGEKKGESPHNSAKLEMIHAEKEIGMKNAIAGSMHFFVGAHTFWGDQHQLRRARAFPAECKLNC